MEEIQNPEQDITAEIPQFVFVHSMVRARQTRLQRYLAPEHHSFKQYIMGGRRLVRNRYIKVTWDHMLRHLPELLDRSSKGMLECRTPGGQKINLEALVNQQISTAIEAPRPAPAVPHPPLDSAANDKPAGTPMPHFIGGVAQQDPAADRIAERLAAEKQLEAERKGAVDDEQGLQELLQDTEQPETSTGEEPPLVADEQQEEAPEPQISQSGKKRRR